MEKNFIPNILICGDKAEFLANVVERAYKIVGEVKFVGDNFNFMADGKFLLNDETHEYKELPNLLNTNCDYLIFVDFNLFFSFAKILQSIGCPRSQLVSIREFNNLSQDTFRDITSDLQFMLTLQKLQVKTLLDVNAYFMKSQLLTKILNNITQIDCIFDGDMLPIKENIFSHVYKNFSDCRLKHYDAAIISVNSPLDFNKYFLMLDNCDVVIIFSRHDSEIEKHLRNTIYNFAKVNGIKSFAGNWFFCYRHKPPEDFAMYVVTHKKLPTEHVEQFPAGYKIIHAGRELSEDLGYLGDNTGDNVSYLNPYINEITALYWMYKNTNHSIIGLSHYRRFFTESDSSFAYEKILTQEQILNLLKDYDIILNPMFNIIAEYENMIDFCGVELTEIGLTVIKKYLSDDYIKSLDYIMNSRVFYKCNMFVTRRNIFDEYCRWLFSFYIDATQEILTTARLQEIPNPAKRLMGLFSERLFATWLIRNNLRIKELDIMQVPNL